MISQNSQNVIKTTKWVKTVNFKSFSDINYSKFPLFYYNKTIDKGEFKKLIRWIFENYGKTATLNLLESFKRLGFSYASFAGLSLSIDDLSIPNLKHFLITYASYELEKTENRLNIGEITSVEYFQKLIDIWNQTNEDLKSALINNFIKTNSLNPVYMMAFSGARGNISQVRQLVGMRGLMANPQGEILDFPIQSNFKEGLSVTEYIISCYGARKGLVDTALRTADSGYLTRRLVDIAQGIILREKDCQTKTGFKLQPLTRFNKPIFPLEQRLVGRVLAESVFNRNQLLALRNQEISPNFASKIQKAEISNIFIRSPLTCQSPYYICQLCYGWNLATGHLVQLGEAVGILAAQSIGEPGTQLTMRTFHTGGVFTAKKTQKIIAPKTGWFYFSKSLNGTLKRTRHGDYGFFIQKKGFCQIKDRNEDIYHLQLVEKSVIFVANNTFVIKNQIIGEIYESSTNVIEKATKQVFSNHSGEILLTPRPNSNKNYTLWVLYGELYQISKQFPILYKPGDKLNKTCNFAEKGFSAPFSGSSKLVKVIGSDIWQLTRFQAKFNDLCINPVKYEIENNFQRNVKFQFQNKEAENFYFETLFHSKVTRDLIIGYYDNFKFQIENQTSGLFKNINLTLKKIEAQKYEILEGSNFCWVSNLVFTLLAESANILVNEKDFIKQNSPIAKGLDSPCDTVVESIQKRNKNIHIICQYGKKIELSENNVISYLNKNDYLLSLNDDKSSDSISLKQKLITNAGIIWLERIVKYIKLPIENKRILSSVNYIQLEKVFFLMVDPDTHIFTTEKFSLFKIKLRVIVKQKLTKNFNICLTLIYNSTRGWSLAIEGFKLFQLITSESFLKRQERLIDYDFLNRSNSLISPLQKNHCFKIFKDNLSIAIPNYLTKMPVDKTDLDKLSNKNFKVVKTFIKSISQIPIGSNIGKVEYKLIKTGEIHRIFSYSRSLNRLLFLTKQNFTEFFISNFHLNDFSKSNLTIGEFVKKGGYLTNSLLSSKSGQIIRISFNKIRIRRGRPYYISNQTGIHVKPKNIVNKNEVLLTLIYNQEKTEDIVQGLPKIEEFLEARKTKGFFPILNNVHTQLKTFFKLFSSVYDLEKSIDISFQAIQKILVNNIQLVYYAQDVSIADKHIEIIVRQMTTKVLIQTSGETGFLPGELVDYQRFKIFTHGLSNKGSCCPILLGVTKAALNTESFLSAASFQETTRILTQSAIRGKTDWLYGLKENVILGRLIPAGTGFYSLL